MSAVSMSSSSLLAVAAAAPPACAGVDARQASGAPLTGCNGKRALGARRARNRSIRLRWSTSHSRKPFAACCSSLTATSAALVLAASCSFKVSANKAREAALSEEKKATQLSGTARPRTPTQEHVMRSSTRKRDTAPPAQSRTPNRHVLATCPRIFVLGWRRSFPEYRVGQWHKGGDLWLPLRRARHDRRSAASVHDKFGKRRDESNA